MKVVLDTNVLISVFIWRGKMQKLFNYLKERKISICLIDKTFQELQKVLRYPRIKRKLEMNGLALQEIEEAVLEISGIYQKYPLLKIVKEDPQDNFFLSCAVAANAKYIVSGDRHLLTLKKFCNIKIITPAKFIELL